MARLSRAGTRLPTSLGAAAAFALLVACADRTTDPSPDPSPEPPGAESAILLSAPVPQSQLGAEGASGTVVFVSARPGTFPRGARATLAVRGAGAAAGVGVAAGGFDAVPLRAKAGDEIEVVVTDSAGARRVETGAARAPTRPRVVRTSPGATRSDVPLNSLVQVVFSAPMDTASVAAALELRRGGVSVSGTIVFRDEDRLAAVFVPAAALQPSNEYVIELEATARDVLGQSLEASFTATFVTAASVAPPVQSVTLDPVNSVLRVGEVVELSAWVCVQFYTPCAEVAAPVTWTSSAPGVASIAPQGGSVVPARAVVTAVSTGTVLIVASSGTAADTVTLFVASPPPASVAIHEIVFARTNLFAIRADGTGLRQLTTGRQQSEPSVAADGRIAFVQSDADPYQRRLAIRDVDGSVRELILPAPATWWPPRCPAWSPDMRYLAYLEVAPFYGSGIIRVVHADSTSVQADVSASDRMTCPKWSPAGDLIAAAEVVDVYDGVWGGAVFALLSLPGAELTGGASGQFFPGQWSPDGREVVMIANETSTERAWVERRRVDGTLERRLWPLDRWIGWGEAAAPAWSPDGTLIAVEQDFGGFLVIDASNSESRWWGEALTEGRSPTFVPPGVSFTR